MGLLHCGYTASDNGDKKEPAMTISHELLRSLALPASTERVGMPYSSVRLLLPDGSSRKVLLPRVIPSGWQTIPERLASWSTQCAERSRSPRQAATPAMSAKMSFVIDADQNI